jgi:hypothetical protein
LLIPLRCPHGFDEDQLNLGMCEETWGLENEDISILLEVYTNEYSWAQI